MKVIYVTKILQLAIVVISIYGIINQRCLCSKKMITAEGCITIIERYEDDFNAHVRQRRQIGGEMKKILPTDPDFPNIIQPRVRTERTTMMTMGEIPTKQTVVQVIKEKVKNLRVAEENTTSTKFNLTMSKSFMKPLSLFNEEIDVEEETTEKMDDSHEMTSSGVLKGFTIADYILKGGKNFKRNEERKEHLSWNRTHFQVVCLQFNWNDVIWNYSEKLSFSPVSVALFFFIALLLLLSGEIFHYIINKNIRSKLIVWLLTSTHVLIVFIAAIFLFSTRLNWNDYWLNTLEETPNYPTGWLLAELAAWLLIVLSIVEIFFYRGGSIVYYVPMGSYDVAKREMLIEDGSYEI